MTFLTLLTVGLILGGGVPSPTAHYPMEGTLDDSSGNGHHATPLGGVSFGPGHQGQAAFFDGIDDYVQAPNTIDQDFSVAFWLRTSTSAPSGANWFEGFGLVDGEVCGSPTGGDWGIALLNGGHVAFGGTVHLESTSEVNDDRWHQVILTREDGVVSRLFIDGLEEASSPAGLINLDSPPWIGFGNNPCDVSFNRLWFPGALDEVRFYDRTLTEDEVNALSGLVFADGFESGDTTAW